MTVVRDARPGRRRPGPRDACTTPITPDVLPADLRAHDDERVRDVHAATGIPDDDRSIDALLDEVAEHDTVVLGRSGGGRRGRRPARPHPGVGGHRLRGPPPPLSPARPKLVRLGQYLRIASAVPWTTAPQTPAATGAGSPRCCGCGRSPARTAG